MSTHSASRCCHIRANVMHLKLPAFSMGFHHDRAQADWAAARWRRSPASWTTILTPIHSKPQPGTTVGVQDALGSVHCAAQAIKRVETSSRCSAPLVAVTFIALHALELDISDGIDPLRPSQLSLPRSARARQLEVLEPRSTTAQSSSTLRSFWISWR